MQNRSQLIENKNETLFQTICRLVEDRNERALQQLIHHGTPISTLREGHHTPVSWLAKQGKSAAVMHFIKRYQASPHDAVLGAMEGGHVDLINVLMALGANANDADWGAAKSEQLNTMENALRLIASIDDPSLREKLTERAKRKHQFLAVVPFLTKSRKLNRLMREYQLNYEQAHAYLTPGMYGFLLQAASMFNSNLPADVITHIASYIHPLKAQDSAGLQSQIKFKTMQKSLSNAITGQLGLFRHHKKTAGKFLKTCSEAQSTHALVQALNNEARGITQKKDRYNDIIDSYQKRLK